MSGPLTNWAGNITFSTDRISRCCSVEELQELVASSDRLRVLGTGHSFNPIADTTGTLVSVADLPADVRIDGAAQTVSVPAGLRYGELTPRLQADGVALHNLGSLPHISIAGACATGTHGSGDGNRTLASAVSSMEFVGADGGLVRLDRTDPDFSGAVVSLGALGVMVRLTLDLVPAYEISQVVYDGLPVSRLGTDFDAILGSAYSVSAFTDWQDPQARIWRKMLAQEPLQVEPEWHGATLADGPRHPVPGMPAEFCTQQGGVPGPWHERLPHFRLEFTPSNGEELQSEYFLPRRTAAAAIDALRGLGERMAGLLQIGEIRTIAAEDLWLSPSEGRDTVAFHFTWVRDYPAVLPVVAAIEEALLPLGARPHWGKVFAADAGTLRECYPRTGDFIDLIARYDPAGKFRNDYLDRNLPQR
ncbi:MAG TPA: D-arabinono-1,4-lactone oxidase [Kribbella sp.]|nr:D-arabinono-1,4-lactone oxidase [Kribbella sp.]